MATLCLTDRVLRFAVDHLVSGTFKTLSRGLFNLQSYYFSTMGLIPIFRLVEDSPHVSSCIHKRLYSQMNTGIRLPSAEVACHNCHRIDMPWGAFTLWLRTFSSIFASIDAAVASLYNSVPQTTHWCLEWACLQLPKGCWESNLWIDLLLRSLAVTKTITVVFFSTS